MKRQVRCRDTGYFFSQKCDSIGRVLVGMLKISKKTEYGLISLLHMADRRRVPLATAKEIADAYDIPSELLGKVLQSLARGGLVESVQGSRGGYRLTRNLEDLSLGEVVESVDGPILIVPCCDGTESCRQHTACNIKGPIQKIQENLVEYMHDLSLAQFRTFTPLETGR